MQANRALIPAQTIGIPDLAREDVLRVMTTLLTEANAAFLRQDPAAFKVYLPGSVVGEIEGKPFALDVMLAPYLANDNPLAVKFAVVSRHVIRKGAQGSLRNVLGTICLDNTGQAICKSKKLKPRLIKFMKVDQDPRSSSSVDALISKNDIIVDKKIKGERKHFHGKYVRFYYDEQGNLIAYSMFKRFKGKNLEEFLDYDLVGCDLKTRVQIAINLLEALATQIHQSGVIHRDLKPDNIMIDVETLEVKIIDIDHATKKEEAFYGGSCSFMSKEVINASYPWVFLARQFMDSRFTLEGDAVNPPPTTDECISDQSSDVYSMAIIIGILLGCVHNREHADEHPAGEDRAMVSMIRFMRSEVLGNSCPIDLDHPNVTPDIKNLLLAMLDPDKRKRPTALEAAQQFKACLESLDLISSRSKENYSEVLPEPSLPPEEKKIKKGKKEKIGEEEAAAGHALLSMFHKRGRTPTPKGKKNQDGASALKPALKKAK